ncbi:hypothetical protein [Lewinella sp. 4G2]|uniref:hypothetical protein n=1 Tax=Lewinella sp. 4G2 TaxID=1803372 RepID=UPI0007B49971|nr:hypothetical protein [Lewinella sp. 4G2]OAV42779.1 hypothetical protein A3850_016205 [Lewinella sp. 4G2]
MESVKASLAESFGLPALRDGQTYTEERFLQALADAIDYWMQYRMEELMSLCYTLDVDEAAVAFAFHPSAPDPANHGLARLLYDRQIKRLETKRTIKSPPVDDEDAW